MLIIYTENNPSRLFFLTSFVIYRDSIQERLKEDKVKKEHGAKKERVPKWSKEAFNDKLKKVKCTLEEGRDLRKNHKIGKDYIYLSPLFSLSLLSSLLLLFLISLYLCFLIYLSLSLSKRRFTI